MGKVCTRFPPEPSGYMHIGHAKAAILNQYYATRYHGRLILRFDDTNPAKEKLEFIDAISEDLGRLGIHPDVVTFTSDHFDEIIVFAERMLQEGRAYIDDTPVTQMREERGTGAEAKCRTNDVATNMHMWQEMIAGSPEGCKYCMRAKIDMNSENGCMRDPVLFRVNLTPHPRTKTKYHVYPSYDFACPIVDSLDGVTHALRTIEYHDRNEQYQWVLDSLKLRNVHIWDFSRMNFVRTVLSKRRLQWFVEHKLVEGWNDPRFPTIQGMLRRGMVIGALRSFILEQGASKATNLMQWDKIWAVNKKFIDPVAPHYSAVVRAGAVPLLLRNAPDPPELRTVPRHRKNPAVGTKTVELCRSILLDQADAAGIAPGEEVTLMNWGNAVVDEVVRAGPTAPVTALTGHLHPEGSVKDTRLKLTWIAQNDHAVPARMKDFDFLITKEKLEETDDFEKFVNPTTVVETELLCDAELRLLKEGDIIQLERKGFFYCDRPYARDQRPLVLHLIPDGRQRGEKKE